MLKKLHHGALRFLLVLGLLGSTGCRIRDYMVPWIVDGELEKIENQKAHQCVSVAWLTRGATTVKVDYTVDFAPPDRLRYEFQPSSATGAATVLCVSTEAFVLYDPLSKRAERVVNLPPFSKETFIEFRKAALRSSLEQNKAYAENAESDPDQYWQIRTKPKKNSIWPFETTSHVSKETKNNIRAWERNRAGKVLNRFETPEKTYDVDFPPGHFALQLPKDCAVVEYDLSTLQPFDPAGSGPLGQVPQEHGGLALAQVALSPHRCLFDYTLRQMVLFYVERREDEQPLLKSPVSREVELATGKAYINYAGTYTTCRWRSGGWDRLVFTNLGPERALSFAQRVTLAPNDHALLPAAPPAGADPVDRVELEQE